MSLIRKLSSHDFFNTSVTSTAASEAGSANTSAMNSPLPVATTTLTLPQSQFSPGQGASSACSPPSHSAGKGASPPINSFKFDGDDDQKPPQYRGGFFSRAYTTFANSASSMMFYTPSKTAADAENKEQQKKSMDTAASFSF